MQEQKLAHNTGEPGRFLKVVLVAMAIGSFVFVLVGAFLISGPIIPLLLVGFAVYTFIRRGLEMRWLATEGVESIGTVRQKSTFRHNRYQIKYAYQDSFGREHQHFALVPRELYNNLEVGSPVKVVYLPRKPSVSALLSDVEVARRALGRKT
jgi:fatty acid desaturase